MGIRARWRDVPVTRKLFGVVGTMAVLIVCELLTLRFAMNTLSAARAFVGGEGLWSKSQKNAAVSLQRFGRTRAPEDFEAFERYLEVPEGDHRARLELQKAHPDLAVVRQGFRQGRVDEADIDPMIELLQRFHRNPHLARAIAAWTQGDELLTQFRARGYAYRDALRAGDDAAAAAALGAIGDLNEQLTQVEDEFSFALGSGSQWMERVLLGLLALAVLVVESVGLTLTFVTGRWISRGLAQLDQAARRIGEGEFQYAVAIDSRDEIGRLAEALTRMGALLRNSYAQLDARVRERTAELASASQTAQRALKVRDEFLSIASHELMTPLASLRLQLQLAERKLSRRGSADPATAWMDATLAVSLEQVRRLTHLVGDLLDASRIQAGKLTLQFEEVNLTQVVESVAGRFAPVLAEAGCALTLQLAPAVTGTWDPVRIEEVIENLLSNAAKYAPRAPVVVSLERRDGRAFLEVADGGPGVPVELQAQIFERFERAAPPGTMAGWGLGLFIVREFVRAHGGRVWVDNRPDGGARFRVELPLARPTPAEGGLPPPPKVGTA